jgi:hypothetical protein
MIKTLRQKWGERWLSGWDLTGQNEGELQRFTGQLFQLAVARKRDWRTAPTFALGIIPAKSKQVKSAGTNGWELTRRLR